MRKIILIFLFGFLIFQAIYADDSALSPKEWDFGKVKQGEILKHDFLFKNETRDIINISGLNTSCGCTVSKLDKKILKPQEFTTINVSFDSHGYFGEVKQFIYLNTDSVVVPLVKFTIKVQVNK
ncbi:MAG: DUF1573 domain-containing protein [Candidatus Omnitrophota bacterium]